MYCNATAALSLPVSATLSTLILLTTIVLVISTAKQFATASTDVIGHSLLEEEDGADRNGNYSDGDGPGDSDPS
jgi:hypothetical protein